MGNGFDPNATLDIYIDSSHVGLVDTDNNGSFGMALRAPTIRQNGLTIQIPGDAVPGQHWITAVERITQLQAQVPFTVRTDWSQFQFDAEHTGLNLYENVLNPATVPSLQVAWKHAMDWFVYSPTVANGVVYVGSPDGKVYAVDATAGTLLWSFPMSLSSLAVPAVANGVVYVGSFDGNAYALDAATGALRWKRWTRGAIQSPLTVANGLVYASSAASFYAMDAGTGSVIWKYDDAHFGASAAVANGVVFVSGEHTYALNARTGALIWKRADPGVANMAVADGVLYASGGPDGVTALDASTGVLLWRYQTAGYGSAPAVADGVVYAGYSDFNIYALNAHTGALLWKYPTGAQNFAAPAVANGVVYVGSDDQNVYALVATTGELLWKYTTGSSISSSPAVVNGTLYIGSDDGNLYAFGLPAQQMSEEFSPPQRPDPARLTPDWSLQPNRAVTSPLKK